MKKIWITSLDRDPERVQEVFAISKKYGLSSQGHFWVDDLKNMAWLAPREALQDKDTALWVLLGSAPELAKDSVRYGLSLLAISIQAQREHALPLLLLLTAGEVDAMLLPTALQGCVVVPFDSSTVGAKMVALANMPLKKKKVRLPPQRPRSPHQGSMV